ncbi:MAG: DUF6456 domain-containing protein [Pseudomonadota bacterium]
MVEAYVAYVFRVQHEAIRSRSRGKAGVARARQVAMYLCHTALGFSLTQVGKLFERDRTTVGHACRLVEDLRDQSAFDTLIQCLERALQQQLKLRCYAVAMPGIDHNHDDLPSVAAGMDLTGKPCGRAVLGSSPRSVDGLLACREALFRIADGRKVEEAAFETLRRLGYVGGTRALPQITARGATLLDAEPASFAGLDGDGEVRLHIPDVVDRLAQARGGQKALLDPACVEAARRFAGDLHRAGLNAQVSQNWSLSALNQSPSSSPNRLNFSERQVDARNRVRKACDAIGPDFTSLLIDLCLFEKNVSAIEADRQWPPRSAKLAIALGLRSLARFYGLAA